MSARQRGPWARPGGQAAASAASTQTSVLSYETYVNLIRQLDDLIARFENHPDPVTREQAVALLGGLDALHREGLTRLVGLLRDAGAGVALERAAADPVVEILLGLYDLVDLRVTETPPPPPAFIPLASLRRQPRPARSAAARTEGE